MAGGACVVGVCACQGDINGDGWGGACMAGGHAWHTCPPPADTTVNERSVRILLECILVIDIFF